jgi:hypothetical protein
MPDMDQTTFITQLGYVFEDLEFFCALFDDTTVTINLVAGQAEYVVPDNVIRNWASCYMPSNTPNQWYGLRQTSIDFNDYNDPGWRTAQGSQPQEIYFRGSNVGFLPPPSITTAGGYPCVILYVRQALSALSISSNLPPLMRTDLPIVYRTCERYAVARYPQRAQMFGALAKQEEDKLLGRDYGRNARDHAAIRPKRRWIRAM